jgi:hypothetical protein
LSSQVFSTILSSERLPSDEPPKPPLSFLPDRHLSF